MHRRAETKLRGEEGSAEGCYWGISQRERERGELIYEFIIIQRWKVWKVMKTDGKMMKNDDLDVIIVIIIDDDILLKLAKLVSYR